MKNLFYLSFLILSFLGCSESNAQSAPSKIKVAAFEKLISSDKSVQIIDVRTPQEVANGFIAKSVNINSADADFKERLGKLDKSKPVAVYCAAGGRSGKASAMLTQMGFKTVYDLEGGMTAWNSQNKPTIKR